MDRERDILWRVSNWYFSKKVLPYWVILLTDALVVFLSCLFTYWVANKSQATYDHHIELLTAAAFYAVLSWVGARCFRTYSGVLRYSSFVDLLRVVYANSVNLAIAVVCALIFKWQQVDYLDTLTPLHLIMSYILATALIDTGSKMDDIVFEEFKGTGNMELVLDRRLSERRIFPAIDIVRSGTRREDLLLTPDEYSAINTIRRSFNGLSSEQAVTQALNLFSKTRTNGEFINMVRKVQWGRTE